MKSVTIHLINEVTCTVTGLTTSHLDHFYNKFAYFIAGYQFSPRYELGLWDGKIHRFDRRGNTYMYLLDDFIVDAVKMDYNINIIDDREPATIFPDLITGKYFSNIMLDGGESLIMRDYQVNGVNALLKEGGGILLAGTGSGKTYMGGALIESYRQTYPTVDDMFKSITIVPDINLVDQTVGEYRILELDVGEYSGNAKELDHSHIVSTWQSLQHNPEILHSVKVLLLDECHGAKADVLFNLLNTYGNHIQYKFGLTGTLPKDTTELMTVHISLGNVVDTIPAHLLIEQGWLAKLDIKILQLIENFEDEYAEYLEHNTFDVMTYNEFKKRAFPEYVAEKKYLSSEDTRTDWVVDHIQTLRSRPYGNTFVLVNSIAYGRRLAKKIPNAHFLYGMDKIAARKKVYGLFTHENDIVVITTSNFAAVGLNIKRIFHMVAIDQGKSFIRVIQTIGRSLRKAHDKQTVEFYDICSDLTHSKKHLNLRKQFYNESKYPFTLTKIKRNE